jgi:Na+/phosphate symporter
VRELEKSLEAEKQDYNKKIGLYKDQVKKMKQNIELFKDSINQLQLNNQELQARQLLQQQQESKTG